MAYKLLKNREDFNAPYSIKEVGRLCLPEEKGQFIFIDNCYLPLVEVLGILKENFVFDKFLLIRCLVDRRVCIRVIFFSCEAISQECRTFYKSESHPETRSVISSLQGPIKSGFHNLAKYRFLKAFCDSYIGMTSENLLCSRCCMEDVQITINTYFCWRFDYKRMALKESKQRDALLAQKSSIEQIRFYLDNMEDYLEWGTHAFDIEDLSLQMDIVDDFFEEMRFPKEPLFRRQPKEVYYVLPDGRKLFLGFEK